MSTQSVIARHADQGMDAATFWRLAHAWKNALAATGAERCAICLASSIDFAAAFMAACDLSLTIVLPPTTQAPALIAEDGGMDIVLTDTPDAFTTVQTLAADQLQPTAVALALTGDDQARVQFYTSGSSGAPTTIEVAFGDIREEVAALDRIWRARVAGAVIIGTVPHYHHYGLSVCILWPLLHGHCLYAQACSTPSAVYRISQQWPCVIVSSPAFMSRMSDDFLRAIRPQVRAVFSAGAPLEAAVAANWHACLGQAPLDVYGSSETGIIAWRQWQPHAPDCAYWQPLYPDSVRIEAQQAEGALEMRLPYSRHWFHVGDRMRWHQQDRFELLGRADRIVKIADKRVSLVSMRQRLLQHAFIDDVHVVLLEQPRQQLGAAVILNARGRTYLHDHDRRALVATLRDWLAQTYERVVVPRKWRFVDAWPEDAMSKVTLANLRALFEVAT